MKDAIARKSFLDGIREVTSLIVVIVVSLSIIVIFHGYKISCLSSRVSDLETKLTQQEALTKATLGVDHKERIQAVYNAN